MSLKRGPLEISRDSRTRSGPGGPLEVPTGRSQKNKHVCRSKVHFGILSGAKHAARLEGELPLRAEVCSPLHRGTFVYPAGQKTRVGSSDGIRIGHTCGTSDQLAVHGMHHGLKPVMCTKLVVDVVQMVSECLQADPKFPGNFSRILAF
jgi:hypothetical protein